METQAPGRNDQGSFPLNKWGVPRRRNPTAGSFGLGRDAASIGRTGGKASSSRKRLASALNGQLGGRPKKSSGKS
jgi:hypothetical protein